MNRHPFYANLLAPAGYRYCIGGTLSVTAREASLFSVQRTKKQGHVGADETGRMRLLLPHVRQAFDTTRLLRRTNAASRSFEAALDWLPDGAALTRADGRLLYANQSLRTIARAGDGVRTAQGRLEFAVADVRRRYAEALAALSRTRCEEVRIAAAMDFAAMRPSGAPPYLVSIRPLPHTGGRWTETSADAIVFVRDPWQPHNSSIALLREVFGFTPAEASLAQALQQGIPLADYARQSALSLNTVYTHLRRIKEKTGCHRMPALIRKLNDLQVPLRFGSVRRERAAPGRSDDARAPQPDQPAK
jgi:DNA-binding CsgD family transcriptional regulator